MTSDSDGQPLEQLPLTPEMLRYLEHVRVQKRLAARTHTLYTLDLQRLQAMAGALPVPAPRGSPGGSGGRDSIRPRVYLLSHERLSASST